MPEFTRTSYDKYNTRITSYVEDDRSDIWIGQSDRASIGEPKDPGSKRYSNPHQAADRISTALESGKKFVLPGEITDKHGVSLRVEDLTGNFAQIVRKVIEGQTDDSERHKLEGFIGFIQGKIEGTIEEQ